MGNISRDGTMIVSSTIRFTSSFLLSALILLLLVVQLQCLQRSSVAAASSSDLETTLPVSPSTFWKMAHSEEFYRNTRIPSKAVSHKVLNMGKWVSRRGRRSVLNSEPSSAESGAASNEAAYFAKNPAPRGNEMLEREVILEYNLRSPFGTFDASNDQTLELTVEGETITYTETNRLSGFPGTSGDILGRTTWAVTPGEDDPNSVEVRVAIYVRIMPLPFSLGWLQRGIRKTMEKSMLEAAKGYMEAMEKEAVQPQSNEGRPLRILDAFRS